MAEANIKVDPKQLKNYSNDIKTGYKTMYSYLTESKTAVKNLKSTWSGSGSSEFYSRFDFHYRIVRGSVKPGQFLCADSFGSSRCI